MIARKSRELSQDRMAAQRGIAVPLNLRAPPGKTNADVPTRTALLALGLIRG